MNNDALLAWLLEGTLTTSAALLLVFALRLPLRRWFGAGIAYASWALVPLSLLAISLPAPLRQASYRRMWLAPLDWQSAAAVPASALAPPSWWMLNGPALLAAVWACGALLAVLLFWRQQWRFVASLGRMRPDAAGLLRTAAVAGCPAVVGAWQPRIVLPIDFEARYPSHEGELVLAHERVHLARHDVRMNLLAVALRCVYWFNPLLHAASRAYRQDQELACDAAVLARHPHSRRAYADAMLKTQLAVLGLPVGCHWQSSQSLKERILMLKKPLPRRGRARLGAIAVVALLLGITYAAWALQPESAVRTPSRLGTMLKGDLLYADVAMRSGYGPVFVVDGSMGPGPGGVSRVYSGKDGMLRIGIGSSPEDPAALLLTAGLAGNKDARELEWRLERAGKHLDGGNAKMPSGQPVTLEIDSARYGTASSAIIDIMHSGNGALIGGEFGRQRQQLPRGADGAYMDARGIAVWSEQFKTAGQAQVLVQVSAGGEVVDAIVESSVPAGAFTNADARLHFKDAKYDPLVENGTAIPARIRTTVKFSPPVPVAKPQPTVPPQPTTGSQMLDPPSYPPDLAKQGIGGEVVLIVDVAADGRPTAVKVDRSEPAGIFDAAAVEAVWKWKFRPQMQDGKPVSGRVRVPIQFAPNGEAAQG